MIRQKWHQLGLMGKSFDNYALDSYQLGIKQMITVRTKWQLSASAKAKYSATEASLRPKHSMKTKVSVR